MRTNRVPWEGRAEDKADNTVWAGRHRRHAVHERDRRVTVSGGRITAIEALQLPSNEPKSVAISTAAESQLHASALAKQSAEIDAVSGATITSAGYEASLQSALDKLGFEAADGSRGRRRSPRSRSRTRSRSAAGPRPPRASRRRW